MNIDALIQAAEFLERRDRGKASTFVRGLLGVVREQFKVTQSSSSVRKTPVASRSGCIFHDRLGQIRWNGVTPCNCAPSIAKNFSLIQPEKNMASMPLRCNQMIRVNKMKNVKIVLFAEH